MEICILLYYFVSVVYMLYTYQKFRVCPELLWCAMQLLMFFGLAQLVDYTNPDDRLLVVLYLMGLFSFIGATALYQKMHRIRRVISTQSSMRRFRIRKPYLYTVMAVSMVICALFFIRGGGNVFLNSLRAIIQGQEYSTKYARMALLSIRGVGYVYQLRVTIVPVSVLYFVFMKKNCLMSYVLSVLMVIFLVGTGQRGGLVSFAAICVLSLFYWAVMKRQDDSAARSQKKSFKMLVVVIAAVGVLFGLTTIMNGRVGENGVIAAVIKRFINDNQNSARMGFRYIRTQDIQYGYEWLMQLKDILPGKNDYMSVSTRIFAYVYGGSTAGTAPPCIWGSAYHNFGVVGIPLLGALLGWGISKLHHIYSRKVCDEWDIIAYSGLQFLLCYWVAADPTTLFNNGFVALILMNILMYIALKWRIVIRHKRGIS